VWEVFLASNQAKPGRGSLQRLAKVGLLHARGAETCPLSAITWPFSISGNLNNNILSQKDYNRMYNRTTFPQNVAYVLRIDLTERGGV